MASASATAGRLDWVDYAKGLCIVFVVMMHSTLGVEAVFGKEGWMHHVVAFAKPFRMPDFFLISGLFLARVIDRDWRLYLDRKVVHFAYFYVLWVTIQFAFKAPSFAFDHGWAGVAQLYLTAFVQPFGTLWFIYLLPIFFVLVKLLRRVPPLAIFVVAAALEIAPIETGWLLVDEFAARFVYFFMGYWLAPLVFRLADAVQAKPASAVAGLLWWAALNQFLVARDYADLPFVSLGLGILGAAAIVAVAALMAQSRTLLAPFRYFGVHSIVVYLAFFLPMAASRSLLIKSGVITDIGTISLLVTMAGVIGAICIFWAVRGTPARFLFERPQAFWLAPKQTLRLRPAD